MVKCSEIGCSVKNAVYNYLDESGNYYCKKHSLEGMIDVKNKRCKHESCLIQPSYNYPNEDKGVYCKNHALEGMINVKNKRCKHESCVIRPNFNYPDENEAMYCKNHALEGMINVINKRCKHESCLIQPNFNYPNEDKGVYCKNHALEGMINVVSKRCMTPMCDTRANPKYVNYCLRCHVNLHPDEPNSRNYKTKEKYVADIIKQHYPNLEFLFDKTIPCGQSRRRPDIITNTKHHVIIVEIDEEQHKHSNPKFIYNETCEIKRINQLCEDLDYKNIVMIRFNPDGYYDKGIKIKSPWKINKYGMAVIFDQVEMDKRIRSLIECIDYYLLEENQTNELLTTKYLFFNSD